MRIKLELIRRAVFLAGVGSLLVTGSGALAAETADPIPLAFETPQARAAPVADGDLFSSGAFDNRWHAVAIRSKSANDTLTLYSDSEQTTRLARSAQKDGKIDFIAYWDENIEPVYPVATRKSGDGDYSIEASAFGSLSDGQVSQFQIVSSDVLQVWNAFAQTTGETLTITVEPSKKLDVSIFLMAYNGSSYRPREFAVASSSAGKAGEPETIVYQSLSQQTYGFVVLFEKGRGNMTVTADI